MTSTSSARPSPSPSSSKAAAPRPSTSTPCTAAGPRFFEPDGASSSTAYASGWAGHAPAPGFDGRDGFDLPRRPASPDEPGSALIPDHRNGENLAVAQLHLAFIRFHNRVVGQLSDAGVPGAYLLEREIARVSNMVRGR